MVKLLREAQLSDPGLMAEIEALGILDDATNESVVGPPRQVLNEAVATAKTGNFNTGDAFQVEAIVRRFGFPSLIIQDGTYEQPERPKWAKALDASRPEIEAAIAAVGRLEFQGHSQFNWNGTGWRIDDDVIITNQHVAKIFCDLKSSVPTIEPGIKVRIDFREEFERPQAPDSEFSIDDVIYVEMDDHRVDLALFRLSRSAAARLSVAPLRLNTDYDEHDIVAAIGYPARSIYNDASDQDRIFGSIHSGRYDVKRLSPGTIIGNTKHDRAFQHDCTTLGGMSGSAIISVEDGHAVGLHFSGMEGRANNAVKAEHILDRCRKHGVAVKLWDEPDVGPDYPEDNFADDPEDYPPERTLEQENFADRDGYDPEFLGGGALRIPLPRLNSIQQGKVAKTREGNSVLNYRHLSAVINGKRRLAYFVAANVDGSTLDKPTRVNRFRLDPRLDAMLQSDNQLYKNNPLDRGHLIRRLDPCWGTPREVNQANIDSMYFTNIAPQHKNLNQKIWLKLENHILSITDRNNFKVSVIVGCIFDDDDPPHERTGIQVPMGFWKIVASISKPSRNRRRRTLQAQAFVLMQDHLVRPQDLEFVFGREFETFQLPVSELELMTGLDFDGLKDADTFGLEPDTREQIAGEPQEHAPPFTPATSLAIPIRTLDDVVLDH